MMRCIILSWRQCFASGEYHHDVLASTMIGGSSDGRDDSSRPLQPTAAAAADSSLSAASGPTVTSRSAPPPAVENGKPASGPGVIAGWTFSTGWSMSYAAGSVASNHENKIEIVKWSFFNSKTLCQHGAARGIMAQAGFVKSVKSGPELIAPIQILCCNT